MTDAPSNHPGSWAARTPDRPAIVMADSGATVTYAELEDAANRLSQIFWKAGFKPGDHVAFCMENRAEFYRFSGAPTTRASTTRRSVRG